MRRRSTKTIFVATKFIDMSMNCALHCFSVHGELMLSRAKQFIGSECIGHGSCADVRVTEREEEALTTDGVIESGWAWADLSHFVNASHFIYFHANFCIKNN